MGDYDTGTMIWGLYGNYDMGDYDMGDYDTGTMIWGL